MSIEQEFKIVELESQLSRVRMAFHMLRNVMREAVEEIDNGNIAIAYNVLCEMLEDEL